MLSTAVQTDLPLVSRRGFGVFVDQSQGTVCNTVLDSPLAEHPDFSVHPDWITLRVLTPNPGQPNDLLSLIGDTLRDVFEVTPGPHKIREHNTTYDWMGVSAKGIKAYWHNPGNGLRSLGRISSTRLEFPGKLLSSVNSVDLRDLMGLLYANEQAVCTRLDIAGDDYSKSLWNWEDLHSAAVNGHYSGPQSYQIVESAKRGEKPGMTYYFGTRKSEAFYRFYDKSVESGGVVNANRIELELKRSKAHQAFVAWLQPAAGDEVAATQILAEFLMGNVDFIDRDKGDKNLDRCPRLGWWQAFRDAVAQGVKLAPIVAVPTIERTAEWLVFKVGPSLAMLRRVVGERFEQFLEAALGWGVDHQTSRHDRMVAVADLDGWEWAV